MTDVRDQVAIDLVLATNPMCSPVPDQAVLAASLYKGEIIHIYHIRRTRGLLLTSPCQCAYLLLVSFLFLVLYLYGRDLSVW